MYIYENACIPTALDEFRASPEPHDRDRNESSAGRPDKPVSEPGGDLSSAVDEPVGAVDDERNGHAERDPDPGGSRAPAAGSELEPGCLTVERVGAEICRLAGQIAAATSRFLRLLADFDARQGVGRVEHRFVRALAVLAVRDRPSHRP
jgi:hypothetical protein